MDVPVVVLNVAVVSVGVATDAVVVPPGPWSVDVVSVFWACTSSVPVRATADVPAALGATVPSCCAAVVVPVDGEAGSPVPLVPVASRSVAFPFVVVSAGCSAFLQLPNARQQMNNVATKTMR